MTILKGNDVLDLCKDCCDYRKVCRDCGRCPECSEHGACVRRELADAEVVDD